MKRTLLVAAALAGSWIATAHASPAAPEEQCQAARVKVAGAYAACQQNAQAKWQTDADQPKFLASSSKCRVKYTGRWAKLQRKGALVGSSCDNSTPAHDRFVDNGNGTFTDNLTGLQWEKKTNDLTVHSVNNTYSWSASGTAADGTAFTTFLSLLNTGVCFAGQCDWRLPTRDELQTILLQPYPCTTIPCIDPALGPTNVDTYYWSSTTYAGLPDTAWVVEFGLGSVVNFVNDKTTDFYVRAVRGGL